MATTVSSKDLDNLFSLRLSIFSLFKEAHPSTSPLPSHNGFTPGRNVEHQQGANNAHLSLTSTEPSSNAMVGVRVERPPNDISSDDGGSVGHCDGPKPSVLGANHQGGSRPCNRGTRNANLRRDLEKVRDVGQHQHHQLSRTRGTDGGNFSNVAVLLLLPVPTQGSEPLFCADGPAGTDLTAGRNHGKQSKGRYRNIGLRIAKSKQPGNGRVASKLRRKDSRGLHSRKILMRKFDEGVPSVILVSCPNILMTCTLNIQIRRSNELTAVTLNPVMLKGSQKGKEIHKANSTQIMMHFLIWNARGENNAVFRHHCEALVSTGKPVMLVLLETKMAEHKNITTALRYDANI